VRQFFAVTMDRAPLAASILAALALAVLSGCARHISSRKSSARPAPPQPARIGTTETGIASWYGNPYHGRPTASGEIFDMEKLTAAHRSLAFQTWLEVTNLSNGKHVEVRVTDRGPFVGGRIIDLSLAAARQIDMVRTGTARVRLKVIAPPEPAVNAPEKAPLNGPDAGESAAPPAPSSPTGSASASTTGLYAVQAGAFADKSRAEVLRNSLAASLPASIPVRVIETGGGAGGEKPGETAGERPGETAGAPLLWHVLAGSGLSFEEAAALAPDVRKSAGAALIVRDISVGDRVAPDSLVQERP
jgi:rare lipoprotein A